MRHYCYSWKMHFLYSIVLLFAVVPSFFADEAWSRDAWSDAAHLCHAPDGFAFASKGPIDSKVYPDDCDDGDSTIFEQKPLEQIAQEGNMQAYKHTGFWKPMDTLRDNVELNEMWDNGTAPWKIW